MGFPTPTLRRVAATASYLVVGVIGTAAVALAVLYAGGLIQPVIYDAFYLEVGPSEATETVILTQFLLARFTALSAVLLAGDTLGPADPQEPVANAIGVLLWLVVVFLLVALLELAAFFTALLVLAVAVLAVPLLLRYRYSVRSGGVPAFVGGVPVVILLLLLAGFGLSWG